MAATKHAEEIKKDTREYITTALIQMVSQKPLSDLTVSDVCKRAGVSRMAFYRNFDNLEHILHAYYQPKIAAVFDTIGQNPSDSVKYDIQIHFFNTFGDFISLSVERGFEGIIQEIFIEEMEKFYAGNHDEYWTVFLSAGVYAIWKKWLMDGRQKPLHQIMELLKRVNSI